MISGCVSVEEDRGFRTSACGITYGPAWAVADTPAGATCPECLLVAAESPLINSEARIAIRYPRNSGEDDSVL